MPRAIRVIRIEFPVVRNRVPERFRLRRVALVGGRRVTTAALRVIVIVRSVRVRTLRYRLRPPPFGDSGGVAGIPGGNPVVARRIRRGRIRALRSRLVTSRVSDPVAVGGDTNLVIRRPQFRRPFFRRRRVRR